MKQGLIDLRLRLQSWGPRFIRCLKAAARVAISPRFAIAIVLVPLLFYVFREIMHDALVIDPFIVPVRLTDAGFDRTSDRTKGWRSLASYRGAIPHTNADRQSSRITKTKQ